MLPPGLSRSSNDIPSCIIIVEVSANVFSGCAIKCSVISDHTASPQPQRNCRALLHPYRLPAPGFCLSQSNLVTCAAYVWYGSGCVLPQTGQKMPDLLPTLDYGKCSPKGFPPFSPVTAPHNREIGRRGATLVVSGCVRMSYPPGKHRGRKCTVCQHPEAGRIDYLIVTGAGERGKGRRGLAEKFELTPDAIYNHSRHHISPEYRRAILAGPFRSEDDLRQLVAEAGQSVLVNFRSLFNSHRQRWLVAFEAGDDVMMVTHAKVMGELLWKIGKLTQEIAPPQTFVQNNTVIFEDTPEYIGAITALTAALRPFPEARQAVAAALRALGGQRAAPLIEVKPAL
jgi:hypothetical protein